ncbi:MAG: hypothetical protein JWL77_1658 [Chthonomonadaceae bacterium]|nr:hypothetical protein [Chthonomonadaceae bacterium]
MGYTINGRSQDIPDPHEIYFAKQGRFLGRLLSTAQQIACCAVAGIDLLEAGGHFVDIRVFVAVNELQVRRQRLMAAKCRDSGICKCGCVGRGVSGRLLRE